MQEKYYILYINICKLQQKRKIKFIEYKYAYFIRESYVWKCAKSGEREVEEHIMKMQVRANLGQLIF